MRKYLKRVLPLLMALAILFSIAMPTVLAAENEIKVPISIKLPHAVAGVELEFNYSSGLTFVEWEKSDAIKAAAVTPVVERDGNTVIGIYNRDNSYAPDSSGVLDLGYLVFTGTTVNQKVVIENAEFIHVINKSTLDTRDVTAAVTIDLSGFSSDGSGSSGIVIDGNSASTSSSGFPFTDVKATDWFYGEVKGAYENGLINGVTATEYRPNETLTVAQAIKLAAALHQLQNSGKVTLQNGTSSWYSTFVNYAVTNKIIESKYQGYTSAQMNAAITRKEFVHIFHGAMSDYPVKNTVANNAIPDVKTTDTYGSEIYAFYRAGILVGSNGGYFKPNDAIKRSEVAAILVRMYDITARQEITLS